MYLSILLEHIDLFFAVFSLIYPKKSFSVLIQRWASPPLVDWGGFSTLFPSFIITSLSIGAFLEPYYKGHLLALYCSSCVHPLYCQKIALNGILMFSTPSPKYICMHAGRYCILCCLVSTCVFLVVYMCVFKYYISMWVGNNTEQSSYMSKVCSYTLFSIDTIGTLI